MTDYSHWGPIIGIRMTDWRHWGPMIGIRMTDYKHWGPILGNSPDGLETLRSNNMEPFWWIGGIEVQYYGIGLMN